jgi:NhaP-type Na+/H+ and K+/H+ antiporter
MSGFCPNEAIFAKAGLDCSAGGVGGRSRSGLRCGFGVGLQKSTWHFATLARRLQKPYPIVLVVAGSLLGPVPGIPRITLDPDLIFLVALPPLLYAAASVTSWRDISYNLVSVLMLAVGLVGFTVLGVGLAGHWLISSFDRRVGLVLGAAVATTDAIAATSIAKRVGLPKHIVDLRSTASDSDYRGCRGRVRFG